MILDHHNWKSLLDKGFELQSSGTSGTPKTLFQTPEKLSAANKIALEAQTDARRSYLRHVAPPPQSPNANGPASESFWVVEIDPARESRLVDTIVTARMEPMAEILGRIKFFGHLFTPSMVDSSLGKANLKLLHHDSVRTFLDTLVIEPV